ncbi:MAG: transaldolase, partial [Janthinobacterium lividum]|nr:transaldolase [Janthinobacterium lividum]
ISPDLLAQLEASSVPFERALGMDLGAAQPAVAYDEAAFRYALNDDAMASEKLAEGIRGFAIDAGKLDAMIEQLRSH